MSKIKAFEKDIYSPESTPVALDKIKHHQPLLLVCSSQDKVAIVTYSLFVTSSVVQNAVCSLASDTCSTLDRGASIADATTVPTLPGYSPFDGVELETVSRSKGSSLLDMILGLQEG
jgi:hypothetical protein